MYNVDDHDNSDDDDYVPEDIPEEFIEEYDDLEGLEDSDDQLSFGSRSSSRSSINW